MAYKETDIKCFTFLWKLENISYCTQQKEARIESPAFVVDAIESTKWKLRLYPRGNTDGNYIAYFLNREADSNGADKVEIKFELAFIGKDGAALVPRYVLKRAFPKNEDFGYNLFQKREDIYILRRTEFLPQDTLTVRCRMLKSVGKMTEEVRCTAHTRIGVEKRSFLWEVKNFSTLRFEEKRPYHVKSIENETTLMSVNLSLTGGLSSEEIISFELSFQDKAIYFYTQQLSLVDAFGNRIECNQDEFWLDSPNKCKQFIFFFTKKKLLANKSVYLPDDILSLHWECAFSKGVLSEEIEEVRQETTRSDIQTINNEIKVQVSHTLNANLKSLYDKQFLCDVKLKTSTSEFPAHKIILSATSAVFHAMFANDMKEKDSDCVNIEDLSDDVVRRMLLYIYSARMEDVTWESASHLYVAADKYAILCLKSICSSYLKDNLSPNNACEVLLLADFHADGDLKASVQDYILKHDKDIINSDEWKLLMETNGKLAAETLCLRYK